MLEVSLLTFPVLQWCHSPPFGISAVWIFIEVFTESEHLIGSGDIGISRFNELPPGLASAKTLNRLPSRFHLVSSPWFPGFQISRFLMLARLLHLICFRDVLAWQHLVLGVVLVAVRFPVVVRRVLQEVPDVFGVPGNLFADRRLGLIGKIIFGVQRSADGGVSFVVHPVQNLISVQRVLQLFELQVVVVRAFGLILQHQTCPCSDSP